MIHLERILKKRGKQGFFSLNKTAGVFSNDSSFQVAEGSVVFVPVARYTLVFLFTAGNIFFRRIKQGMNGTDEEKKI